MPKAKTQNKLFVLSSVYGQNVIDNGAKWGSYVTRNQDGTIPFDERLYLENPTKWQAMMDERMQWLNAGSSFGCAGFNSIKISQKK
jgi:hypothetical protein